MRLHIFLCFSAKILPPFDLRALDRDACRQDPEQKRVAAEILGSEEFTGGLADLRLCWEIY